ncbi:glycosyltransferase family 4 protein [Paenarthrobacter aromaticivorans]|uniref:glycosyltransferase family 4 protein n=1 Tax=Paenarthrobacter aromaticivorans TaxID=2849150 RepID=UPI003A808732
MQRVVILQEYVPAYRKPFFEQLIRLGLEQDVEIIVAAGKPSSGQSERGDAIDSEFVQYLPQVEVRIGGRRLVVRRTRHVIKSVDLVVLEQARRNLDAYGLLLRRKKNIVVALWGHGRDYVKKPSKIELRLQRYLAERCGWFFAYTEAGASHAINLGVSPHRMTVVRNSVDTTSIRNGAAELSSSDLESYRRSLGLTEKSAVYIGGLDASKRIEFLLESARIASDSDPDFRLLIVGDGVERSRVEAAAAASPSIVYVGPQFGPEKVRALLACQVIAMPGRVGLVAVDSFAAGRPIVTTDWPLHAPEFEYLTNGSDCVVTPNDSKSFANALNSLTSNKPALQTMQAKCLEKSEDYSIDAMATRFMAGIRNALISAGKE